jgi:hypothetical protein
MFNLVLQVIRILMGSSTLHQLLAQARCPVKSTVAISLPMAHQAAPRLEALLRQLLRHPLLGLLRLKQLQ